MPALLYSQKRRNKTMIIKTANKPIKNLMRRKGENIVTNGRKF